MKDFNELNADASEVIPMVARGTNRVPFKLP